MRYQAIGFDYGGVIGGVHMGGPKFKAQVCTLLNISDDEYSAAYFSLNHKIVLGELTSWRAFWTLFLDMLNQSDQLENLMALNEAVEQQLHIIDTHMVALVDRLRGLGYKTGLLSNTTLEGGYDMRQQKLDAHFDVFHISAETKRMKPHLEAYAYFISQLGIAPEQLIFIDDSSKMLSAAAVCGFTPLLFKNYQELVADLESLKVLPA